MVDKAFTEGALLSPLLGTDVIPCSRPGSPLANNTTPAVVSAYITANLTGITNQITIGVAGATKGKLTLASLDGYGAAHGFQAVVDQGSFSGHPDDLLFIGWNRNGGSTSRIDATKHSISVGFENYYYVDPTHIYTEYYVEYWSASGTVNRRPYDVGINLVDNSVTCQYFGKHMFYDSAGDSVMVLNDAAGGPLDMEGTTYIRFFTNDAPVLKQLNAGGTYFASLIKLMDNNHVKIGETGYPPECQTDLYFQTDLQGPILLDRVTGLGRRLVCTNGALTTEAI